MRAFILSHCVFTVLLSAFVVPCAQAATPAVDSFVRKVIRLEKKELKKALAVQAPLINSALTRILFDAAEAYAAGDSVRALEHFDFAKRIGAAGSVPSDFEGLISKSAAWDSTSIAAAVEVAQGYRRARSSYFAMGAARDVEDSAALLAAATELATAAQPGDAYLAAIAAAARAEAARLSGSVDEESFVQLQAEFKAAGDRAAAAQMNLGLGALAYDRADFAAALRIAEAIADDSRLPKRLLARANIEACAAQLALEKFEAAGLALGEAEEQLGSFRAPGARLRIAVQRVEVALCLRDRVALRASMPALAEASDTLPACALRTRGLVQHSVAAAFLGDWRASQRSAEAALKSNPESQHASKLARRAKAWQRGLSNEALYTWRRELVAAGEHQSLWRPELALAQAFGASNLDSALSHQGATLRLLHTSKSSEGTAGDRNGLLETERRRAYEQLQSFYAGLAARQPEGPWKLRAYQVAQARRADLFGHSGDMSALHPDSLSATLSARTVLLDFSICDDTSLLWFIDSAGYEMLSLPGRAELAAQVASLLDLTLHPGKDDTAMLTQSHELFRVLLAQEFIRLRRAQNWIIFADDVLSPLPFAMLLSAEPRESGAPGSPPNMRNQPWLSSLFAISQLPSLQDYRVLRKRERLDTRWELIAAGDPPSAVEPTGDEVDALVEGRDPKRLLKLVGTDLTQDRLRQALAEGAARIVHFASPVRVRGVGPRQAQLQLAEGNTQMAELFESGFRTDFMVLSMVDGASSPQPGVSVAAQLDAMAMDAGVGGLLRATWPVSDETARLQLLQRFYGSLYARRAPADKALQTAQRALLDRESSAHPFYWAGYVVVGTDTTPW